MRRFLVVAVVVLLGAAWGAARFAHEAFLAPGPLAEARDIVVPRGGPSPLGAMLQAGGVVASADRFRLAAWWTRKEGPLHAGEFSFPAGASLRNVLTVLRTAHPVQHRLTIPEGLTAAQVAELLDRTGPLEGDAPVSQEGAMLPQTYAFERGTNRAALAERATKAMDVALADAWAGRDPGLPLQSPAELLTLASIVERETARADERPLVAAVYVNRLRQGMRLQADPTVAYETDGGLGGGEHRLTRADLDRPGPYNTYRNTGLPPGPIADPGVASLQAAAHPATTDDLFFVADGTGGHVFARTAEEHARNVARWRALGAHAAVIDPGP